MTVTVVSGRFPRAVTSKINKINELCKSFRGYRKNEFYGENALLVLCLRSCDRYSLPDSHMLKSGNHGNFVGSSMKSICYWLPFFDGFR